MRHQPSSTASFGSSRQVLFSTFARRSLKELCVLIDALEAGPLSRIPKFRAALLALLADFGLADTAPARGALSRICTTVLLVRPMGSASQSALQCRREVAIC
jgi:hypothetical protein